MFFKGKSTHFSKWGEVLGDLMKPCFNEGFYLTRSQVLVLMRRFLSKLSLILFSFSYFKFIFFYFLFFFLLLEMICVLGVDIRGHTLDYWIFVLLLWCFFFFSSLCSSWLLNGMLNLWFIVLVNSFSSFTWLDFNFF